MRQLSEKQYQAWRNRLEKASEMLTEMKQYMDVQTDDEEADMLIDKTAKEIEAILEFQYTTLNEGLPASAA